MKASIKNLVVASVVGLATCQVANAIPELQLYIEGATYDSASETWVANFSSGTPIKLWTIGNIGAKGTIFDVKLAIAYDSALSPTFTFTPTTANGITDPSTPSAPSYNTSGNGTQPLLGDGSALPSHGIYGAGTAWQEFALGDFTLTDSPIGDFISSYPSTFPSSGQINAYEILVSGADSVHFDLYDHYVSGTHARYKFAPFSHDGEGNNLPDGGMTISLLGFGLLGLGFMGRRKA